MRNRMNGRVRRRQAAFSLIELLLVLVILAVLAAVIVPKFTNRSEQARVTAAKTEISSLKTALGMFEVDNGKYPGTEEGLQALILQPSWAQNWRRYIDKKEVPVDPWGNQYVYRYPGSDGEDGFDLYSLGPDGREGNDDITE